MSHKKKELTTHQNKRSESDTLQTSKNKKRNGCCSHCSHHDFYNTSEPKHFMTPTNINILHLPKPCHGHSFAWRTLLFKTKAHKLPQRMNKYNAPRGNRSNHDLLELHFLTVHAVTWQSEVLAVAIPVRRSSSVLTASGTLWEVMKNTMKSIRICAKEMQSPSDNQCLLKNMFKAFAMRDAGKGRLRQWLVWTNIGQPGSERKNSYNLKIAQMCWIKSCRVTLSIVEQWWNIQLIRKGKVSCMSWVIMPERLHIRGRGNCCMILGMRPKRSLSLHLLNVSD